MTETAPLAPLVLVANAGDGSIASFRLDGAGTGTGTGTGARLEPLAVTPGLAGCSTFAVDTRRDLVHAAVKGTHEGEPAGILTLALDRATGALTPRTRLDLPADHLNYIALTRDGDGLLAASYGGGYGISCAVGDGVVAPPESVIHFPNLHSVLASPDGAFAYFVSLGADLVAQYALGGDMALHPLTPETVAAPDGVGPRHLVLTESGDTLYVLTEFTVEVLRFAREETAGTLTLLDATPAYDPSAGLRRSAFGLDPRENHALWGADLHLAGGDGALWASERSASTLAALTAGADGSLTAPTAFTTTEPQPRGFAVSLDGAHLVAAGERSTTVSLYAVDGARLELLQQIETGRGANWVRFA